MKRFKYLFLFILMFGFAVNVKALDIPEADITYTTDWEGTLELTSDQTVKISGITHSNVGTTFGSPIKISNNATVNLVFEGDNVLTGNSSNRSAGIEVSEGSTVNIYGLEGSTLTVTGGHYSAGIGGIGSNTSDYEKPKAGNINIYSGNIKAYGGTEGAGIGSGRASSASNINIYGGYIEAYGGTSGAGIGSGYGTSGGSVEGVGCFNGGNITISGGTVKAAAYVINFDMFDPYNTATLYDNSYSYGFGAGIGGGYGSSSGNIVIEGDANVLAISGDGGAAIGSGRGTTRIDKYDSAKFDVNVTIKGNANVMAFAINETRQTTVGQNGGAAIGLGRGTGYIWDVTGELVPVGTVKIKENATVYAVASHHVQAIGASNIVGSFVKTADGDISEPRIGKLETLEIADTATVIAINDGYVDPIDKDKASNFVDLTFTSDFLDNFDDTNFPLYLSAIGTSDYSFSLFNFAIQNKEGSKAMVQLGGMDKYNISLRDYPTIYLANDIEDIMTDFYAGSYELTRLSGEFFDEAVLDYEDGELNIMIVAPNGIFELGSTMYANIITDPDILADLKANIDDTENLDKTLFIDLGVKNADGENYSELPDNVIVIIQIPEGFDESLLKVVFVTGEDDEDYSDVQVIENIDGIKYVSFETSHFSNYGLLQYSIPVATGTGEENNTTNPATYDSIYNYLIILIVSMLSFASTLYFKKRYN